MVIETATDDNDPVTSPVTSPSEPAPAWVAQYQPGVPATIEVPDEPLGALLARATAAGGDEVALEFFGATTSWRSLDDQVSRLAQALRHRYGVRPGDRVALLLPNSPQHVIAFYAVLRIGAVVVEHNPLYTASELGAMFADHGATVAIAWDVAAPKIEVLQTGVTTTLAAWPKGTATLLPVVDNIVVADPAGTLSVATFDQFLAAGGDAIVRTGLSPLRYFVPGEPPRNGEA